jgi:hypothetical protein
MTTLNNNANAVSLGMQAAAKWNSSQNAGDAGDALAITAMYYAARTMSFSATVERKKEGVTETVDFDLDDLASPLYNADGSKDTKAMAARTLAMANKLFGVTTLSNAMKQRIGRSLKAALYLSQRHALMDDDAYFAAVVMKGSKVVVPYAAVHASPAVDASDNDKAVYEAMSDKACTLDGKNGASVAELLRRANPPKATRAAGDSKDEGATLKGSVQYVHAVMLQQIAATDECDIALGEERRKELYALMTTLTAYFAADPVEVAAKGKKAA